MSGYTVPWQPIDTAPKDGSPVLLWDEHGVTIGAWDEGSASGPKYPPNWRGPYWAHVIDNPTHWAPLPEGPEVDA